MGTSAFDKAWDGGDAVDRAWESTPVPRPLTKTQIARNAKSRAELNAADMAIAKLPDETPELGGLAAFGRWLPGAELLQAGAKSLWDRQPYRQSLEDIRQAERDAPATIRNLNAGIGSLIGAMATPGSTAARQAAAYSAATPLLSSDPDKRVVSRGVESVASGLFGGLLGKAGEAVGTAVQSRFSPSLARVLNDFKAQRAEASGPGYRAFRALSPLKVTPQLESLIGTIDPATGTLADGGSAGLPIVRRAIETVKGESPVLAKLPDNHPEVLDAVYKRIGNKAFAATHGYQAGEARDALLPAIEESAQLQSGSYADPVGKFRAFSEKRGAATRGANALLAEAKLSGPSPRQADEVGKVAFGKWADMASPAERDAAAQGIMGQMAQMPLYRHIGFGHWTLPVPILPSRALLKTPGLLSLVSPRSTAQKAIGSVSASVAPSLWSIISPTTPMERLLDAMGASSP